MRSEKRNVFIKLCSPIEPFRQTPVLESMRGRRGMTKSVSRSKLESDDEQSPPVTRQKIGVIFDGAVA